MEFKKDSFKTVFKVFSYLAIAIVFLYIAIYLVLPFILASGAKYLTKVDNLPKNIDAIVVLSGGTGERLRTAYKLYSNGNKVKIIMSGGGTFFSGYFTEYMADYAQKLGVSADDIIEEKLSLSTYENAFFSYPIILQNGFKDIVIITSKFHTKRAYRVFKKVFAGSNVNLYMMSSADDIDYSKWWLFHEMSEKVLIEWAKTFVYWIKY